ncbi:MAG: Gfo/Idh/MocA family oxidoreductase [Verrucomicrobiota bacterium]
MSQSYLTRRDFISFSATVAALLTFPGCATDMTRLANSPRKPRPIAPGARIRIAQIGCGGKGFSDVMPHKDTEEIVALCDIDWEGLSRPSQATKDAANAPKKAAKADKAGAPKQAANEPNVKKLMKEFPNAKRYTDFRKMLIEMDDQIDAVIVSTPDHMHFLPAYMAIMLGKHVYVQKPLTQTVGEARELLRLARLNGVVTQMGNQGHAAEGIRLVKEWINAGLLGEVREAHIWTNRPIWPQGFQAWPEADPVPKGLDWESFIGRSQMRPFSRKIHPFNWRGFQDYGCGALGDMACHLMDAAFWGLELGSPTSVELKKVVEPSKVAFPRQAIVEYQFPARGKMPPVKVMWYEGGLLPDKPGQMEAERTLAKGGQLLIGSKGTVYDGNDYCNSPRFVPESLHQELGTTGKFPPKTIPRVLPGTPFTGSPYKEWSTAIRAGDRTGCGSNFEYSVPFTEMVALGTMAILVGVGKKITFDPVSLKTNFPEADALLYPTYRSGWAKEDMLKGAKIIA